MSAKIPMKLFVVEPRGSGGMIHYAYQLCSAAADIVTDVTLVTAREYELQSFPHRFNVQRLMNLWSRVDPLQTGPSKSFIHAFARKILRAIRRAFRGLRLIVEWVKLTRYLLRTMPDIVQFGSIEFPFEAIFLGYLKRKGLTLTQICHEFEPRERSNNLIVKINNHLLSNVFKTFSIIFFHSVSNQKRFCDLYPAILPDHFHVIPHGNEQIFSLLGDPMGYREKLKQRYGITNYKYPVVLFFGNITVSKGVPDLLRAFADVYTENKNARLIVAGKPLKYITPDSLLELASTLRIRTATSFDMRYFSMEEVTPLIELATVVVYPYLSSTQSGSIQIAYALGKPVVATRVGGLPDVVEDGKSGFLVSPNSPEELARAILRIINDPELAKRMGNYARELSETRFAWGPIASKIVHVYRDFLLTHG
jgi:glycosyltransferase involved in cell wall biosynthesis